MAICMTAMTSELYSHSRSDPEYFLPSHTQVEADLSAVPTLPLRRLGHFSCSAFYPAATHLYSSDGVPFLRCVDIVDYPLISPDQPFARIPASFANEHSTIRSLRAGDIVISKVGTPCYAALLSDDMPESAMTRTVLGMSQIDETVIDPYYLIAFLRSRHGFDQLMRERELTIQYQLTLERTRKIKVYMPESAVQKVIGHMVRDYYRALRNSVDAYSSAQRILEAELGLDKLAFQKPVGYTARLSESISSGRIDADYFQPQYDAVRSLVRAYSGGYESLLVCCDPLRPNIDPSKSPKQPFEYIELSNINSSIGIVDGAMAGRGSELPSRARRQVRAGDVIASAVIGSIDKAAIISDEQACFIALTGFFHLRPRTVSSAYLLMLVRSQCVRMQFQQQATGGILSAVPDSRLKHVIIPRLPEPIQQDIAGLVMDSHAAKRESDKLLEQAKARVEKLIEEAVQP